jgi:hypothetical protein
VYSQAALRAAYPTARSAFSSPEKEVERSMEEEQEVFPNDVHLEQDALGIWHVYRGRILLQYSSPIESIARAEMRFVAAMQYRLLRSRRGTFHPQWRWGGVNSVAGHPWSWFHFGHPPGHAYYPFERVYWELPLAQRFLAEQCITTYDILDGEPTHYPNQALAFYGGYSKPRDKRA